MIVLMKPLIIKTFIEVEGRKDSRCGCPFSFETPDLLEAGTGGMSSKNTRFGEQPIRGVVRRRHWNLRLIAYETGVGYSHLINAANGITPPSPELRQKLSEFLDLPVEKLFIPESLAATYNEHMALGGKISRRYGRRAA